MSANFTYSRNIRDAAYEATFSFTSSTTTDYSPSLDLGQIVGGDVEHIVAQWDIPAIASLADNKSVTLTLQDSADNITFADVDPATTTSVTGASSAGNAAKDARFRIPPITRRYIRFKAVVTSSSGISGTQKIYFRLLF